MLQMILDHKVEILGAALAISEALALIPAIKSNSIMTLIINILKSAVGKSDSPKL